MQSIGKLNSRVLYDPDDAQQPAGPKPSACPMHFNERRQVTVSRHRDVRQVLTDPATFSSRVSRHTAIPSNLDAPEHGHYRALIDRFFDADSIERFRPVCRRLCLKLIGPLVDAGKIEVMEQLAYPFALQAQCGFLGWPSSVHDALKAWIDRKHAAVQSGDPGALSAVAFEFDQTIRELLEQKRTTDGDPANDVTRQLLQATVQGRPLTDEELVSILRNWTVGELGTIAASVGIILAYLAQHPNIQRLLRANRTLLRAANDEILRIHAPLLTNRRVVTAATRLGPQKLSKDDGVNIMWGSANRDEAVFGNPDGFRLDRDAGLNLLYGAGMHACPGAPLARLELELLVTTVLDHTVSIRPVANKPPVSASYPQGGCEAVFVHLRRMNSCP